MAGPATVVIGAGVVGCLVARELAARDQEVSITVLDRDSVGTGASRRLAGLHVLRGGTPLVRRMSADSHDYYAELKRRCPGAPIHPIGATVISGRADGDRLGGGYLDEAAPGRADRLRRSGERVGRPARPGDGIASRGSAGPPAERRSHR
jgi:glycine/D-amino acid oxidase-like deaminating enzyme